MPRPDTDKQPQTSAPKEGAELEEARRTSGAGNIQPHPPAHKTGTAVDPHTDENLDEGLDETFPASDPVSISPGAD
jgi:hypothetical protein